MWWWCSPPREQRLVADDALAGVEALDELELVEQLERAVDRREADLAALVAQALGDLLRAEAAVLAAEQLDDRPARRAGAVPSRSSVVSACSVHSLISAQDTPAARGALAEPVRLFVCRSCPREPSSRDAASRAWSAAAAWAWSTGPPSSASGGRSR